jgi:hypothetical protein
MEHIIEIVKAECKLPCGGVYYFIFNAKTKGIGI